MPHNTLGPHAALNLRAHGLLSVAGQLSEAGDCDFIQHGLRSNSEQSHEEQSGESGRDYQQPVAKLALYWSGWLTHGQVRHS
jgi:hypothetical protein